MRRATSRGFRALLLLLVLAACLAVQDVSARPSSGFRHRDLRGRFHRRRNPNAESAPLRERGEAIRNAPRQQQPGACAASPPASIKAPKRNLWSQLSRQEVESVVKWLFKQRGLNLTAAEDAGDWDNSM
jgi:hypothetical protein